MLLTGDMCRQSADGFLYLRPGRMRGEAPKSASHSTRSSRRHPHAGRIGAAAVMPPDGDEMHLLVAVDRPSTTAVTILCELRGGMNHAKFQNIYILLNLCR